MPRPPLTQHGSRLGIAVRVGRQLASIAARMGWHFGRVGRQWKGIVARVTRQ